MELWHRMRKQINFVNKLYKPATACVGCVKSVIRADLLGHYLTIVIGTETK